MAFTPWNPVTNTILPSSSSFSIRSVLIWRMRALLYVFVVSIPTCAAFRETALPPIALIAIAISATDCCSPVESSISISLRLGLALISFAFAIRPSVVLPCADNTTTTSFPSILVRMMRFATLNPLSAFATELPPYFCTINIVFFLLYSCPTFLGGITLSPPLRPLCPPAKAAASSYAEGCPGMQTFLFRISLPSPLSPLPSG